MTPWPAGGKTTTARRRRLESKGRPPRSGVVGAAKPRVASKRDSRRAPGCSGSATLGSAVSLEAEIDSGPYLFSLSM
jgi:hypothetical protein